MQYLPLQWRHNERDSVSNHQRLHYLLNCRFRRRSNKTSKLRVAGLCAGIHWWPVNSPHKRPVTRKMFPFNSLRPRQNGPHFPDDIFKWIFLNENVWILIKISLKFDFRGLINNNPALVQIMAWRRPGDKSFSEPMMVSLLTHICVTRPQWVNDVIMTMELPTPFKIVILESRTGSISMCQWYPGVAANQTSDKL